MRITNIQVQGFRAFDENFELDIPDGRNLLLHGENGAGKSSIFNALRRFFEERGDKIDNHRNCFSPEQRLSRVLIRLQGTGIDAANSSHEFHWDKADGHPIAVPKDPDTLPISANLRSLLLSGARRAGFLDYRVMLRASILARPISRSQQISSLQSIVLGDDTGDFSSQLFDLVSLVILSGVPVAIPGGSESTIGTLMRNIWDHRPKDRYRRSLLKAKSHVDVFNTAFNAKLQELEDVLGKLLAYFDNHRLKVKIHPVNLRWEKSSLELKGADLNLEIEFCGTRITKHHLFLNEARLSALAVCLFLAGVRLADNDYENASHPRFLVLDDALIGLELQNRLPILQLLSSKEFKHYQVFLLTHDRVWFDLARGHLTEDSGWIHRELLADEISTKLIPRLRASKLDLEIAKVHLNNSDLKAAAVYARSAFEWRLRQICELHGIKTPFKSESDKIGAGILWDGIISRQREREAHKAKGACIPDFVPSELENEVEVMRSTVLNKLSHSGTSNLVQGEVAKAIVTVQKIFDHKFPKAEPSHTTKSRT